MQILTGKGALAQFGYEVGLPTFEVDYFIVGLVAFNLIAALLPSSATFEPEEKEARVKTPEGPLQNWRITLFNQPKKFFGLEGGFGFSDANELFVGRVAQLGFAASILGELYSGKGPLAQVTNGTQFSVCVCCWKVDCVPVLKWY